MCQFLIGLWKTKLVEVIAKDDKRQFAAVFVGSATGEFYHYSSSMKERLIAAFHITTFLIHGTLPQPPTHWSNEREYFTEMMLHM